MTVRLTASRDACQPSASCQEDDVVLWLQPLSAKQNHRSFSWGRKALLNLTTSLGLGACLAAALGASLASAVAAEGREAPSTVRDNDPLKALVPASAYSPINHAELRKQIIVSIPVTTLPTSEGGEEEEEVVSAPEDYLEFEEMRVPRWIADTIVRASELTGADPVYMMALADKESSFIPANKASTSSAEGLFQFITSTWFEAVRSFGPKHGLDMEAAEIKRVNGKLTVPDESMREYILGLRRNPYLSALMAAEMMQRDKAKIEAKLGRQLSRSEFYLSHFFGVDSAGKFIALVDETPKKSAQSVFPSAARSNKALFYAKSGKKTRKLSVAEVYGKIDTMIDKRLERYEDVSSRVADASY